MAHKGAVGSEVSREPAIRVFTLGRFSVEVDGEPVRFAAKSQRVPLLLLKALIAMGGESVPAIPIAESLWPDSDGDAAYGTLGVTLRRLRLLLKHDGTVRLRDGRLTLDAERAWVDSLAFADVLETATRALLSGRADEGEPLLEQALELYRGPFLDGEFEPNEIAAERERLHGKFLRCMGQLGQYYLDSNDPAAAARLYQRGLEVDPEAEELYRGQMTSLYRQGRYAEALAVYGRCQAVLQGRWQIDPAPETEALRAEIAKASHQARTIAPPGPEPAPVDEAPVAEAPAPGAAPEAKAPDVPDREGERRQATVLMLDLVGYTALTEMLDPEELDALMDRIHAMANEVMAAHGGIVNQFVGDEVVGLFGVPKAQENDPYRAVEAAQAMHEKIREIGADLHRRIGRELNFHTGIATGTVLVRRATGPEGVYAITGGAIVTAARLERLAKSGEILLAPETYRAAEGWVAAEPLRAVIPAGRQLPMVPYRVVGTTPVGDRIDVSEQRGFTPFVAREAEMDVLRQSLASALRNEGRLVSVVGEAGIGKSRLLHEFCHDPELEAVTVLRGHCRSHRRNTPYQPVIEILREGLRLNTNDPQEAQAAQLAGLVEAINPQLKRYIPHYLYMLSMRDPRWPLPDGLQGSALRAELERAIGAIIILNLEIRPVVLVLEDWHWSDEASDTVLRNLASVIAEHPLLVVVTYRPEPDFAAPGSNLSHHVLVELGPLDDAQAERVIRSASGAETVTPHLVSRIQARTEGNPFFIEELCRALLEQGGIVRDNGRAELAGSFEQVSLPDSAQAIVSSRIDRLPQEARRVLRTAAVIGGEFSGPVLAHVLETGPAMPPEMELLRQHELIYQTSVYPEIVFRFNHAIVHDVAYETLPLRTRERLHEQVGSAMEALYPERLEECYEALAHHFASSSRHDKALHYLEQAGDKATRVHSLVEARKHYRNALELLREGEPTDETRRRRCEVAIKLAQVTFYHPQNMAGPLDVAMDDARALGDPSLIGRVTFWLGRRSYALGHHTEALASFRDCLDMEDAIGPELHAMAMNYVGRSQLLMGQFEESARTLIDSTRLLEQVGKPDEVLNSTHMLVLNYGLTGQFDKVTPLVQGTFALADRLKNPSVRALGQICVGLTGLLRGDWEPAEGALSEAEHLARTVGNVIQVGLAIWGQGYAKAYQGDPDQGARLMAEAIRIVRDTDSTLALSAYCGRLGEVYALLGDVKQAKAYAEDTLEMGRAGEKLGDDSAYCALAIAATKGPRPNWKRAEESMARSLDISRTTGARSRLATTLLRYAELLVEQGKAGEARKHLKEARALFKEMGMTWFDAQAAKLQSATRG